MGPLKIPKRVCLPYGRQTASTTQTNTWKDVCTCSIALRAHVCPNDLCDYNTEFMGSILSHYKSFKAIVLTLNTSHHKTASLNTHRVAQVTDQQCFCFRVFAKHKHHGICACSTTQLCSYVCVAASRKQLVTLLASRSGLKEITLGVLLVCFCKSISCHMKKMETTLLLSFLWEHHSAVLHQWWSGVVVERWTGGESEVISSQGLTRVGDG